MWVILVDRAGTVLREAWTLAGSELHCDSKGTVYRRTGKLGPENKPIFKQIV